MKKIHRICLTGGPGSGKTTSLSHVTERLRSLGYRVLIVPEAATLFIMAGVVLNNLESSELLQVQSAMARTILALEDSFLEIAKASSEPAVILYDRGIMDSKAFLPENIWQAILDKNDWNLVSLRDKRYDAVLHLTTAAHGTGYTLDNNPARSETPEQARHVDTKIREAWVGHPHLRVIENTTDFSEKVRLVIAAVCNAIGEPEPLENERKFLVQDFRFPDDLKFEKVFIKQEYLRSSKEKEVERIRQRGQDGSFIYFHTIKFPISDGKNVEKEKMISIEEYIQLMSKTDPDRTPIIKLRHCFLWKDIYFELDVFQQPEDLMILEVEVDGLTDQKNIELPSFIKIDREVTQDPQYSNHNLAKTGSCIPA